ncbi:hypothetical protein BJY01DRAFT_251701 [Aspergillus pseudoustus]|uniref:Uncharacterized protein n=1 Tax=Aspergillus pseudoustus TaxID=1810923 RepID=A0ABR4JAA8_9EURO
MDKISKWLFGTREYRVLLLGDDSSGTTSLLYRLAFDSVPDDPPPTVAFNVERVTYPANHEWTIWEFGATRRNFPIIIREFRPSALVIWLHDCTRNDEGLPDSFERVVDEMAGRGCRFLWIGLNKQDDAAVDAETVQEARAMYEEVLSKYSKDDSVITWKIFTHKLSGKTGEGAIEILDELHNTVRRVNLEEEMTPAPPKEEKPPIEENVSPQLLRRRLEAHIRRDTLDPDAFWAAFMAGDLPEWNHYTHLRAIYFLILASKRKTDVYGLGEDVATALTEYKARCSSSAEKLAAGTTVPERFSVTLSTFWTVKIQRAIALHRKHTMSIDLPPRDEFPQVLRCSPALMNSLLWKAHWTSDPMPPAHSYSRRGGTFLAPHRLPLDIHTEYLTDPAVAVPSTIGNSGQPPDRFLRYAFAVMQHLRRTGNPRPGGSVISEALLALQQGVIRSRRWHDDDDSATTTTTTYYYSETQAYFWMQVVDAALRSLARSAVGGQSLQPEVISFEAFRYIFEMGPDYWREFYSKSVWEGVLPRGRFTMADRRPMPHLIMYDEAKARKIAGSTIGNDEDGEPMLPPSIEERLFRFRLLKQEIDDEDEARLVQTPAITSHGHLLLYLYSAFTRKENKNNNDEEKEGKPQQTPLLAQRARVLFSEITGPTVAGATQRNFWIQQVGLAVSHSVGGGGRSGRDCCSTFAEFITNNSHLVLDNLPAVYYGPAVWNSAEARERIVAADRRRMGSIAELGEEESPRQCEGEAEEWVQVKSG